MAKPSTAAAKENEQPTAQNQALSADEHKIFDAVLMRLAPIISEQVREILTDELRQHVFEALAAGEPAPPTSNDPDPEEAARAEAEAIEARRIEREREEAEAAADLARRAKEARAYYAKINATDKKGQKPNVLATAKALDRTEPLHLLFADGSAYIHTIGHRVIEPEQLEWHGDRAVLRTPIEFPADMQPAKITEAWLHDSAGKAVKCEVGNGLHVGHGASALLPAGHLVF